VKLTGSAILALAALGGLVFLYLRYKDTVLHTVTTTLNPASSENIVNQGVSSVVTAAAGREETLGGGIYDFFHGPAFSPQTLPAPAITPVDVGL
jgi:hypothetical protein